MNAPLDLLALRIDAALAALRAGRPVIVSDDADREDEADLILAADTLSVTEMARMIRDGSGIVCLCLTAEHAARLELPLMVAENRSRHGTAIPLVRRRQQRLQQLPGRWCRLPPSPLSQIPG